MKLYPSNASCRLMAVAFGLFCFAASFGSTADPPRPTPRPGSLGAYAKKISLNRSTLSDESGRVILTNNNIAGLAAAGSITLGTVAQPGREKAKSPGGADNAERSRWQAAHRKQHQVITALEKRRSQLETEINQIEDLGLTAKTMARLEQAESKLRHLDEEISREREELSRIVRDARRRGAEPGWFR